MWLVIMDLFCLQAKPDEVGNVIKAALDLGVRHIDCAWTYLNEREIGEALCEKLAEGNIKREDLFITGKVRGRLKLYY